MWRATPAPFTDENIHDNFISMFDIAKANNIKVVLVSTLPATRFFWQPGIQGVRNASKHWSDGRRNMPRHMACTS